MKKDNKKMELQSQYIRVRGAKEHNLKNVDLDIPKNKLVIFTGVSGSGKTSMAMDTIYAEGQRRYVESLSSYARQFLGIMKKPDVEYIDGLSPAIAIDQKTTSKNPRSTVGTITEIYDYLRLFYARLGEPYCPNDGEKITGLSIEEIAHNVIEKLKIDKKINSTGVRFFLLAPLIRDRKGEYSGLFENLKKQGYLRARVDGKIYELDEDITLLKNNKHTIEAVVDRLILNKDILKDEIKLKTFKSRLFQSLENGLNLADGTVIIAKVNDIDTQFPKDPKEFEDILFSENLSCPKCGFSFPELEPRLFSFNSPHGACLECSGLGTILKINPEAIYNEDLSILEGGIFPLSNISDKNTWYKKKLEVVAADLGVNLNLPIKQIPQGDFKKILYGHKKNLTVSGTNVQGRKAQFDFKWEGIINELERRYRETDSDWVKNDIERFMVKEKCNDCKGARLKPISLNVRIQDKNINDVCTMSIQESFNFFDKLQLTKQQQQIAETIIKEITSRLNFLLSVGLNYLSIHRESSTLSGGEAQRIRLASQIGSGLSGVLYVLDEPSIGLHATDHAKLIGTLKRLRDLGNSVLVVEHDSSTMLESDYILDFGPGAGVNGGTIIAQGTPEELKKNKNSITGQYLSGKKTLQFELHLNKDELALINQEKELNERGLQKTEEEISGHIPNFTKAGKKAKKKEEEENKKKKLKAKQRYLKVENATGNNLKGVDIELPLGKLVCVTGVSGSGKSTLVNGTILRGIRQRQGLKNDRKPMPCDDIIGEEYIKRIIDINQNPIGRTPRSNPVTYTKAFDEIRKLFAMTKEAQIRGYKQGRFSFNVKGGRCEACKGDGQIKIEMQFMPDVYVPCEICEGKRYNKEALEIRYKGKNISDVLNMDVNEGVKFFTNVSKIHKKLKTLQEVGLGYMRLGQPATQLSGGEAQRIKLAAELAKNTQGHTMYILDEPTTGLHFADLEKLIAIIKKLVLRGSTVLVIEHNLDIIKNADYIVDLGLEGGDKGGQIIYTGDVKGLRKNKKSKTGYALRELDY